MDGNLMEVGAPDLPVTVSASNRDAEEAVIGKERWDEVRRMRQEGMAISKISRLTGMDRKTVRACLAKSTWAPYCRPARTETLLAPHREWLMARAPEVNYSARILFQQLRAERGFRGGYDTVRNAVRPLRAEATVASVTQLRFETEPGRQAQVDWGQAWVPFATGRVQIHIFVMTLGFSRRAWVEGWENERIGALLAAHEHGFEHFGGCPAEILYDRMRTVTLGTEEGKPRWNATFDAFARYWGFEPRLCRPYRAQTKGKVESGVKYVKRNFLPGRTFRDIDDFNEQLRSWNVEVADLRIHGTTHERPIDRFAREASALTQTAGHPSFLQGAPRSRVVADDWLVSVDSNRYSVPWKLIGKSVEVLRAGGNWHFFHLGKLVAEHPALAGRHELRINPAHGPGATARNARKRFSTSEPKPDVQAAHEAVHAVEVRDLAVYDELLEAA